MTTATLSPIRRKLEHLSLEEKVNHVLDEWSKPFMQSEGGDITLERVSGKMVYVRLHGVCAGCAAASITLRHMVEEPMQAFIDPDIRVLSV